LEHQAPRRSRKRLYGVLGVFGGLAVGLAGFAFAAAISTTVTDVVVGQSQVASSDADGFDVALGSPTWDASADDYTISTLTVTGLDVTAAGCAGQVLDINVLDSTNASLANVSHSIVADTDPGTLTLSSAVNGSQVDAMAAAVYSPAS